MGEGRGGDRKSEFVTLEERVCDQREAFMEERITQHRFKSLNKAALSQCNSLM